MNRVGGVGAFLCQIIALKDVKDLDQCNAPGRRRRCADYLVAAVGPSNRCAILDLILSQVFRGDEAASLLDGRSEFTRERAMVEVVWVLRDAIQSLRQLWLLKGFASLIVVSV